MRISNEFEWIPVEFSIELYRIHVNFGRILHGFKRLFVDCSDFAKKAKQYTNVVMSIVGLNSVDTEKAKDFVTNEIGVAFRERELF